MQELKPLALNWNCVLKCQYPVPNFSRATMVSDEAPLGSIMIVWQLKGVQPKFGVHSIAVVHLLNA